MDVLTKIKQLAQQRQNGSTQPCTTVPIVEEDIRQITLAPAERLAEAICRYLDWQENKMRLKVEARERAMRKAYAKRRRQHATENVLR
jgi:hypothetical protein